MKTIREIAIEKIPDAFDPDEILPARAGHLVNLERRGFIEGAAFVKQDLTRWHDPKKELPKTDIEVLVTIDAPHNKYDIMMHNKHGWWQKAPGGGWCGAEQMLTGWRYIQEI
jgi:hypothetical protein